MEQENTKILVSKIMAITSNQSNLFNRPDSTKKYIELARRWAEKLYGNGYKEDAGAIWLAIAPFYELMRV